MQRSAPARSGGSKFARGFKNFTSKVGAGIKKIAANPHVKDLMKTGGRILGEEVKSRAPGLYNAGKAAVGVYRGDVKASDGIRQIAGAIKDTKDGGAKGLKRTIKGIASGTAKKMKGEGERVFNNYASSVAQSNKTAGGKMF